MDHGEAVKMGQDNATPAKTKLGLILFGVYSLIYAGFVVINTWSPKSMGIEIFMGLNLAVVYGFGLIVLAIVMGVIYNHVCTGYENKLNVPDEEEKKEQEVDE